MTDALSPPERPALRPPVHPRRTMEVFDPVEVRFVRFTIFETNGGEPCLDELEIYGAEDETRNLALAAHGARATASGSLAGYAIHDLKGVNDGAYGNGRSWIADRQRHAWVQIELPEPALIDRIVWSRDREGKFIDRLATRYVIEGALEPGTWRTLASSEDRQPGPPGVVGNWNSPATRLFVHRFVPVSTSLPAGRDTPSPEYTIDSSQTSDGLPGNTITAISQDPIGYLWLGTLNGLVRFDGLDFEVFTEADGLPGSRILSLLHDRQGNLWIGTESGGLARASGRGSPGTVLRLLPGETIHSLAEDDDGTVWISAASGLHRWRDGQLVGPPPGADPTPAASRIVLHGGEPWCVVHGTVRVARDGRFEYPPVEGEPSQFSSLFALHRGPSGTLWFGGANNYIAAIRGKELSLHPQQAGHLLNSVWELLESRSGDLWIGTASGGLRRFRDGRFISLTTEDGLSDNSIRSLHEDVEGNLWVGTVGGGLNRVKPRRLSVFTTRDGLTHDVVMSLAEDAEGVLWVGSNCGGLSFAHPAGKEPAPAHALSVSASSTTHAHTLPRFQAFQANYVLDNECIWSLLAAGDGSLWIGTWGGGLFRRDANGISHFTINRPGDDEPVIAMTEGPDGTLWIGTYGAGLLRFTEGRFRSCPLDAAGHPGPVRSLLFDPEGGLWIAADGLFHVAGAALPESTSADPVPLPARRWSREDGLPSDAVRTLFRDSRGELWIGTEAGLARMGRGGLTAFTRDHGLPDGVISQILEDASGRLWFGSNRGIFSAAPADFDRVMREGGRLAVTVFGTDDGMEGIECTGGFDPAGLRTRDGSLWISTVRGLVRIDPSSLTWNQRPPPVVIERVLWNGAPQDTEGGGRGDPPSNLPRIPPDVERIEFRFTALSLVSPERNRFRYRLEGLDTEWIEAGTQRSAAYTRLRPGRYEFRVQASNNDGVWNEAGASWGFVVLPPFWATWWFLALASTLVLAGGGWGVRWWSIRKLNRRLERLERQHAIEKERARIARDIHDDLGASLTQISLLTELARKRTEAEGDLADHLRQIADASREMVQAMDAIVWAVNPRNDSLDHLADYISQFAVSFFRLTPIRCRLDVPQSFPEESVPTDARHHLFLATKEALNNVARHSGATEVWLRMYIEDRRFVIRIEDNGRGLPSDGPDPAGDGFRNIRQRLNEIGGRFEARNRESGGVVFILSSRLSHD